MAEGSPGSGSNSGSESGNSSGFSAEELSRMVNDAVSKAIGARMKRLNLDDQIAQVVEKALAGKTAPPAETAPQDHGDSEKLNLKTLAQSHATLKAELEKERQARLAAEQSASQTRLRSDLQATFSKYAGSENPHLNAYLNLYATQFRVQDGSTYHVRRDDFGNEEMVPLDKAAEDLFKGELKHLVPSKTPNLPPTSIARGMPMGQQPGQAQPRTGFLEQEIFHAQAMTDPTLFAELYGAKKPG